MTVGRAATPAAILPPQPVACRFAFVLLPRQPSLHPWDRHNRPGYPQDDGTWHGFSKMRLAPSWAPPADAHLGSGVLRANKTRDRRVSLRSTNAVVLGRLLTVEDRPEETTGERAGRALLACRICLIPVKIIIDTSQEPHEDLCECSARLEGASIGARIRTYAKIVQAFPANVPFAPITYYDRIDRPDLGLEH